MLILMNPRNPYAYVGDSIENVLYIFSINTTYDDICSFKKMAIMPSLLDFIIAPNGRFLYTLHAGPSPLIGIYKVDSITGDLNICNPPYHTAPIDSKRMKISANGSYLHISYLDTNCAIYAIDGVTARLSRLRNDVNESFEERKITPSKLRNKILEVLNSESESEYIL
jgi:6-phosphogluconolactonase (cycloisomerase 2 family)